VTIAVNSDCGTTVIRVHPVIRREPSFVSSPQPVNITEELIRYFVSDPNYPSSEILLQVAGKLLDAPR
jgi:hypothetical protein